MKVVSLDKGSDILKKLPAPPEYLSEDAKRHYRRVGGVLISNEKLKRIHLGALEVLAENFAQWEWAVKEINFKNSLDHGRGYIQVYSSGAKNISVEVTLKRDAEKAIMQCFKQFGLDPKSEKELGATGDPGQMDLFKDFMKMKNG